MNEPGRVARTMALAARGLFVVACLAACAPVVDAADSQPVGSAAATAATPTRGTIGASSAAKFDKRLPIAPRLQWNANFGYCGEVSFISAGMMYGQYTSQWTARNLASPGQAQTKVSSQLLLGENDLAAAKRMKLKAVAYPTATQKSTPAFLAWVKREVVTGHPVIIGVFLNQSAIDEVGPGESEYDHIVPVLGVGSQKPLAANAATYFPTDTVTLSDNPEVFTYRFDEFQKTRKQANAVNGPLYSLRNTPPNYAAAVSGVADTAGVTIPVALTSNVNGEGVQDQTSMARPPAPKPIQLTVKVTIPNPKVAYNVYLYDDFGKVPDAKFNASRGKAIRTWQVPAGYGPSWTTTVTTTSDRTQVFRAVPTSAP